MVVIKQLVKYAVMKKAIRLYLMLLPLSVIAQKTDSIIQNIRSEVELEKIEFTDEQRGNLKK
jgi:hypothetical protein